MTLGEALKDLAERGLLERATVLVVGDVRVELAPKHDAMPDVSARAQELARSLMYGED